MNWIANALVTSTILEFCRAHLKDAHDTEGLSYTIAPQDGLLRVEVDVPTSEMDAWLMLYVDVNGDTPVVKDISCLRSGIGDRSDDVYEWTSETQRWTLRDDD